MPPSADTTRPRPTIRRSARFCLEWPRWAIGARSFAEAIQVAKLVMSSTSPDRSTPKELDHVGDDAAFGLGQLLVAYRPHRVPKAPVVERRGRHVQPAVGGGLGPPVRKAELGTGVAGPVEGGQGDVGPHRRPGVGAAWPDDIVDHLGHLQPLEHFPNRGDVAEGQVTGAVGHHRRPGDGRLDVGGFAQVALGDDLGLAPYSGHLDAGSSRSAP